MPRGKRNETDPSVLPSPLGYILFRPTTTAKCPTCGALFHSSRGSSQARTKMKIHRKHLAELEGSH